MASFTPPALARGVQGLLLILGVSTLAGVLVAGLALPLVGGAALVARSSAQSFQDLPAELQARPLAQRSVVLDAAGKPLATFYDEYRIYRPLSQIPKVLQEALIATEDARFYEHGPIDLYGTSRALLRNLQNQGSAFTGQGGSTLTQQYVKLMLLDQASTKAEAAEAVAQTPARKLRELRLAMATEEQLTKDEILERYLNLAYFGGGAYGVEAAARHYFNKTVSALGLRESALLAGLVQSPSLYDPGVNPDAAKARRDQVLARMEAVGDISVAVMKRTQKLGLGLSIRQTTNGCVTAYAPFFCDYVVNEIKTMPSLGRTPAERLRVLKRGGLTIRTTLDPTVQKSAQKAVLQYIYPGDSVAGAIAMVEPGTGVIKAMAQSKRYGNGPGRTYVNYAVDKARGSSGGFQPGSTMKVFVLAAAIERGIPLDYKINSPLVVNMGGKNFKACDGPRVERSYPVKSSTGAGVYDMREATAYSQNTFYVQLEYLTGLCRPATIAKNLGVTRADGNPLEQVPSFVLGANEVSPLSMAEAYATFAAHGKHCKAVAITSVAGGGKSFAVPSADCKNVLPRNVADTVSSVLAGVIDGPYPGRTGAKMTLGRPAAGKTGTTDNTRAVWFAGYTPQLAAVVGVADPRGTSAGPIYNRKIGGVVRGFDAVCGGCLPGPIWKQAMLGALKGTPVIPFTRPTPYAGGSGYQSSSGVPDVVGRSVSAASAALAAAGFTPTVAGSVTGGTSKPGTVNSTTPAAGSSLSPGSTVYLFVSR